MADQQRHGDAGHRSPPAPQPSAVSRLGGLEEDQVGRGVVEHRRQAAGGPKILRRRIEPEFGPAQARISSAGCMLTKMPKNSTATSRDRQVIERVAAPHVLRARRQRQPAPSPTAPPRAGRTRDANRCPATPCPDPATPPPAPRPPAAARSARGRRTASDGRGSRRGPRRPAARADSSRNGPRQNRPPASRPLTNSQFFHSPTRPQKIDAAQIAQKQRRIAQRQQQAAAIADDENEKDDRVGHVLPLAIGLQQRADQQHRRAGRADEAGQHAPDGQKGRFVSGWAGRSPAMRMPPLIVYRLNSSTMNGMYSLCIV